MIDPFTLMIVVAVGSFLGHVIYDLVLYFFYGDDDDEGSFS